MTGKKFDPKKIDKLNNPQRLKTQNPDVIWNILELTEVHTMVDIGAGTGFFAMPFADKAKKATLYACDTSEVMIDWMLENLPEDYKDRIIPLQSSENSIPLEHELADLVYMINLHHELDDPAAMLNESSRILKPGGRLLVIDWKVVETPGGPPLEIRIPSETIMKQFEEAGFANIKSHEALQHHSMVVGERV